MRSAGVAVTIALFSLAMGRTAPAEGADPPGYVGPIPTPPATTMTTKVIVPRYDLPAGEVITKDAIETKSVPEDIIPPDAAMTVDDVMGRAAKHEMHRGEIISLKRLFDPKLGPRPSHIPSIFHLSYLRVTFPAHPASYGRDVARPLRLAAVYDEKDPSGRTKRVAKIIPVHFELIAMDPEIPPGVPIHGRQAPGKRVCQIAILKEPREKNASPLPPEVLSPTSSLFLVASGK